MNRRAQRVIVHGFLIGLLGSSALLAEESPENLFEKQIRPVLAETCVQCHGAEKQEGGLRLDSPAALLQGGDSGPAVVPGEPDESLLVSAIEYQDLEMPPKGPLDDQQVVHFREWITAGAKWPDTAQPIRAKKGQITTEDRQWWAFQPLHDTEPPAAAFPEQHQSPIDGFVQRQLTDKGMRPAAKADRATLVRRLYQTLIGLPPTPAQVDAFVQDTSEDAYERLVDQLLTDKRYGEHWARFWLDLVRYAESDGWKADAYRPHAWRYRDYVVRAFNEDKPYPEFVREQLAGDEQEQPTPESLAATGYMRLGIFEYNQRNARQHWNDILNEITDITGDVFFGMGLACARCHDHKYDPIPREDYFKLRAFFEPLVFRDDAVYASASERQAHEQQHARWQEAARDVLDRIEALETPYNERKLNQTVAKFPLDIQDSYHMAAEQRASFDQQMYYLVHRQFFDEGSSPLQNMKKDDKQSHESLLEALKAFDELKPEPLPKLMSVKNHGGLVSATVIPDTDKSVEPGYLQVLAGVAGPEYVEGGSSPRTALANWITSPDNPLTVRVVVNRIWKQHFGYGLVRTVNDFGNLGGRPSHPLLLDWLARQFVQDGWQWKRLHKRILMSATWQQAAHHEQAEDYRQLDPQNELLWCRDVRRLTAEQIRDAMLWAGGELAEGNGGPSVSGSEPQRSIYVKNIRNTPDRFLAAFDMANGLKSVGQRDSTTTPTQALMMINGEFVLARATSMARRLLEFPTDEQRAATAIRWAWGRVPTDDERSRALEFIAADSIEAQEHRLVDFCHLLLNSNEFLYLD